MNLLPAHIAAMTAYLTDKLPTPRSERGQVTLETIIITVAILGVVALVVAAIIAAVNKRLPGLQ